MSGRPYLAEVSELLWPGGPGARIHRGRPPAGAGRTFLAVPSGSSPSLLLPRGRAAAAAAVRAYGGRPSSAGRLRTAAVAGLLRSGLGGFLFRDRISVGGPEDGVSDELARILGTPVQVAVRGGPPRANRKPVLAVLDDGGRLLAFAKVGTTPLTRELVRTEADALRLLAGRTSAGVRLPRLLHCAPSRDLLLMVQEPLSLGHARRVPPAELGRAMSDVAGALGTSEGTWGSSPHADAVRLRLAGTPESAARGHLQQLVDVVAADGTPIPLGCWHGDWTSWNCAAADGAVQVWDWERFATGVPLGFDVLHHHLQDALAAGTPTPAQPRALLAEAPGLLAALGLSPRQARVAALAYLVEIASRYLADDQAGAGARVGAVETWLLPAIGEAVPAVPVDRGEISS